MSRNSEYVDKTGLIALINKTLFSRTQFTCSTRGRRFGKSMAAEMLCAYYDQSCDSRNLFSDLAIANDPTFEQHLNKYPVLYLDMTSFVTRFHNDDIVSIIDDELKKDVQKTYTDVPLNDSDDLMEYLIRIVASKNQRFIFIIDEWDAICREFKPGTKAMDSYVNWLRRLFKNSQALDVFAGVYMTGILPIKKYKTESALNNFIEYSMITPRNMAGFFGFTKNEVLALCEKYNMDYDELEKWYDGYQIGSEPSIFNPNSVMQALMSNWCESYWSKTGAYDAVASYINMNFEGLKDDIIEMLAGGSCKVNPTKFQNDVSIIRSKDDVLTVLIHLGYLTYDRTNSTCHVPNKEVAIELANAIEDNGWDNVTKALKQSEQLLQSVFDGDSEAVAKGVDAAHDENTSILSYNNENSLACVLSIAFYYAKNDYIMHRELPTAKGFADIALIPRKNVDKPAILLELKYDQAAVTAINQIKERRYPSKLSDYSENLILVGINYDRKTKAHTCKIEKA